MESNAGKGLNRWSCHCGSSRSDLERKTKKREKLRSRRLEWLQPRRTQKKREWLHRNPELSQHENFHEKTTEILASWEEGK
jgi:hypothetical protein